MVLPVPVAAMTRCLFDAALAFGHDGLQNFLLETVGLQIEEAVGLAVGLDRPLAFVGQ
jgi:hypothetical protein